MSTILSSHERNVNHIDNCQVWRELEVRLRENKTIDAMHQKKIKQQESYWKQILQRLIALVRTLGGQNLAFRGSKDKLYDHNNGNYLKFIEYLALFDPVMNEHLQKVKDAKLLVHYLGKDIQNELIQLLSRAIRAKILNSAKLAKYYSIILDCTPDISHTEQMTIIIRFVDVMDEKTQQPDVVMREHFLGFVPLQETIGAFISKTIVDELEQMGLQIDNLRGQGYDNGSNMKGKINGVSCSLEATSFFNIVQKIYTFFAGSTKRWHILQKHAANLTIKPLSDTRWESRIDALKPLRFQISKIYDALMDIYNDLNPAGYSGNIMRVEAKGIADGISTFKFLVSLITWYNILFEINIISKLLQNKNADIFVCTKQLEVTKNYLVSCRSDENFEKNLSDATLLANELDIDANFPNAPSRRRKIKKQFDYEAEGVSIQDPKQNYKISFYYMIIDNAVNAIQERFNQMQEYCALFGFLYDIFNLKDKNEADILMQCKKFESA
ncbi:zinc finger MYM-type protein 1-like [Onthophagus taurus]|uniref:zinc finger MYM-type protein 1-like n=1 Tax=Onthophagus taurus TaxID=166361 RepID=UPI0039BE038D